MIKLFSGTANRALTDKVAAQLGLQLSEIEIVRFENSEVRVRVVDDVKNDTCVIVQPFANPTDTNLVEFFLCCDALRREEARRVVGVIPYFGYARQNIQHRPGECISVNALIRIMESIGFHKIYTVDIHDEGTSGVFSIPFKNLSAFPTLARSIKEYVNISDPSPDEFIVATPDQGGIERARQFGHVFFGHQGFNLAVVEKKRDMNQVHKSKALDLYGDVKGKTVIIVDDIATSAGTLIHSAELCMEHGATRVLSAVTHHDLSLAAPGKIQDSAIEVFFTTDTIHLKEDMKFEKLREISVSKIISEELRQLPHGAAAL